MKRQTLKTYRQQPRHLNKRATEAMSFRALPEIKNTVKDIAEVFGTSMTAVIIKALTNYTELMQASSVIGNGAHDLENSVAFVERNGG
jgi:predicted transcriptional regulator